MALHISEIMERRVLAVRHDATIADAVARLLHEAADEVYVVDDDGALLGAIPDYELLKATLNGVSEEDPASAVMSRSLRTLAPEGDVGQAASVFRDGRYRQLPVVSGGRLVGVVARCQILRCLALRIDAPHLGAARIRGRAETHVVESI